MTTPAKRPKVGLILFTKEDGTLVAHLQKRGSYDYRKAKKQTWAGVCQPTTEGKKMPDENNLYTLRREACEELGTMAGNWVSQVILSDGPATKILYKDNDCTIYGLVVPQDIFREIRLEPITGGLVRVTKDDLPAMVIARPEWRENPHNENAIVVCENTLKALSKGFRR